MTVKKLIWTVDSEKRQRRIYRSLESKWALIPELECFKIISRSRVKNVDNSVITLKDYQIEGSDGSLITIEFGTDFFDIIHDMKPAVGSEIQLLCLKRCHPWLFFIE